MAQHCAAFSLAAQQARVRMYRHGLGDCFLLAFPTTDPRQSYYVLIDCGVLTGLVRVRHAQGDCAAIPPLLAEAEQLAQQYEYNDHLASLRLTQAHIAWDGYIPEWGKGFDAAVEFYKLAMVYALRFNRFLLDEVLSGRPQGTPLRAITTNLRASRKYRAIAMETLTRKVLAGCRRKRSRISPVNVRSPSTPLKP